MRILLIGLLSAALAAVDGPLPEGGADHAAVAHALQELVRGRTGAFSALPAQAFRAPPAFSDEQEPGLARRWTELLPRLVERLDPEAKQVCTALLAGLAAEADPSTAWDLLPDPRAAAVLDRAALVALDHGRSAEALAIWAHLDANEAPFNRAAQAVAQALPRLAGEDQAPDHSGWILGRDPWGRVRWQRRLTPGERILARAADWTLVAGDGAPQAIDRDGRTRTLPPLPEGTVVLGIRDDVAWFQRRPGRGRGEAVPTTVWSLALGNGAIASHDLPDVPLGPPVTQDGTRWWLTRQGRLLDTTLTTVAVLAEDPPLGCQLQADHDRPRAVAEGREYPWAVPGMATAGFTELDESEVLGWSHWHHRSRTALQPLPLPTTPIGLGRARPVTKIPAHVSVRRESGWLTVTASDTHGDEVWRRRWPALAGDEAPAQWANLVGGTVVVLEGDREATVLMATTGQLLGYGVTAAPIEPAPVAVWPGGIAGVALGRPDRVVTATGVVVMPWPVRWLAAAGEGVLAGGDEVVWSLPAAQPVTWAPAAALPWPGGLLIDSAVRPYTSE